MSKFSDPKAQVQHDFDPKDPEVSPAKAKEAELHIGEVVLYCPTAVELQTYSTPSGPAFPAIVTAMHANGTVQLHVLPPGAPAFNVFAQSTSGDAPFEGGWYRHP